jgi:hypothetical protein
MNKRRRQSSRSRRVPRRPSSGPGEFLMTFVNGPTDEPCDCPICRIMGIDVSAVDGLDVRPITPEQRVQLQAYLAGGKPPN